jgi:chitinase
VGEVDGYIDLAVRLSAPGTDTVSVDYSAIQSTADDGTFCTYDFVPVTGTVKFAPGETTKVVRVELLNCNSPNGFRSFSFTLANAQNATIARAATRVSIVDASTVVETPKLSVRDAVVDEKDGVALVPVLLGAPPGTSSLSTVTVDYTTHDGSATAGADYTATAGTLSFAPGETVKTVVVPIADDGTDEPAENFALGLSNPSNATIAGATGTVQIGASDAAAAGAPALTAPADTIVGQGDGYVDLVVRLSAPGTQAVTVGYSTAPITAAQGNFCTYNYVGASGTLNFAPGETTKAVRVELLDCAGIPAGFETFRLTLTGPVNATIGRANAHIAIVKGGVTLTGLAVTPALPGVTAGTDQQFKATGTLSTGETLDMTQAVTWASSAPGVATVSESGLAHGVTGGTSTITASFGAVSGSAELTVKGAAGQTRTQTITFGPLADRTYGDADFTVSASASSGLPVGFSASGGGCTLAGARVHIAAAGSCTITASQPGDAGTSAAPSVSRAFAIARAAQTISFGALANRTAGEPDFRVGASASSGLAVAFAASGSCTVSGATVHLTGPGSCTLTASQAGDANHAAAAAVSRTFTIAKQAPARRCKVPNVVGKTLAAAKTALTRAHCRVGKVSRAFSGKRRKGVVVAQSRRPKKVVRSGTKVDLVVSRGRKR